MRRLREAEWMDRPDADRYELARSLDDLRRVNRWLGGRRAALRGVLDVARDLDHRPVRVLDVGTGGADIPLDLSIAAGKIGLRVEVIGLDLHPATAAYAAAKASDREGISIVVGNALDLPIRSDSVDIAMTSTTLHHFDPEGARQVLREMWRVARRAVVVTDLARSVPALVGAKVLARTAWRDHPITRHDGPASVRAAFTPRELAALAGSAFGKPVEVRREPFFRLGMVARKDPCESETEISAPGGAR